MTPIKQTHWNEKIVMAYLEDAANIHRRLPEAKVAGYFSSWPETVKDDWERLYDAVNGKSKLGSPMPQEVTFHEEVMKWLECLDQYHQQILWMRANRVPWKVLADQFGRDRTTLWRDMSKALARISSMLSAMEELH